MPRSAEEMAAYMEHWDERTRRTVREHLGNRFRLDRLAHFTDGEASLLRAMLARMIPQPEGEEVDLAGFLDSAIDRPLVRRAQGEFPPTEELIRAGLVGVQETSLTQYGRGFVELSEEEQDAVLAAVQEGVVTGEVWKQVPAQDFFAQLLTQALAGYCAHPFSALRMNYPNAGYPYGYTWLGSGGPLLRRRFSP